MSFHLAASTPLGTINGIGPLGEVSDTQGAIVQFVSVISRTIAILTIIAGLWFIIQVFTSAIAWISSSGDKQALQNAQKKLTHSLIGLLIVVAAYTIVGIVGQFAGLNILDFGYQIVKLKP